MKEKIVHKGKTRIWLGSIITAFVAAISVFVIMMRWEQNMLSQYEKGTILVAAEPIPKGQMISEENKGRYFKEVEVDRQCIPKTALSSPEQVAEMVPKVDIEEGVLLTGGMFETMDEVTGDMQFPVIAGFKAEDLYQVAGGILRTGDRIHIYSVTEQGDVRLSWENVFVYQVFDNGGGCIDGGDRQTPAQRINICLERKNVESFYSELATGTLRVVKVCD